MGLLSRRRKQPRIVKKVKTAAGRKKVSIKQVDPMIRVSIIQGSDKERCRNTGTRISRWLRTSRT